MLQIKQDHEDLIPSFSDNEHELLASTRDRIVRRRSSKACDQCRRAKSKCRRFGDSPCQNCITLGVECTFLGPSRKRGPAKGYLSDLELKLHQMEALIGVLLASKDPRATSLITDMSKDAAARDIINRVDTSLVGTHPFDGSDHSNQKASSTSVGRRIATELADSTHEWQRHLGQIISGHDPSRPAPIPDRGGTASHNTFSELTYGSAHPEATIKGNPLLQISSSSPRPHGPPFAMAQQSHPPPLASSTFSDVINTDSRSSSPTRRTRHDPLTPVTVGSPGLTGGSSGHRSDLRHARSTTFSEGNSPEHSDSEELHDALGQLSLDDASQLRYHGKASGLHLLGQTDRIDNRAENGIWHFPPARVWPPAEKPIERARALFASDFGIQLPPKEHQRMLLDLFFIHINPTLPLFDRDTFMKAWNDGIDESTEAPPVPTFAPSRLPIPLMLVIFSIAMRLSFEHTPGSVEGTMSTTGDEYLSAAKYMMTANPYASSRPATCQSYLLIAFREIGIGAMSQAWLFLGVAIRMAQDLGLHRSVDKFHTAAANLFPPTEKECRNRAWWCCVLLDRYFSTYIGRPCLIFERDYDTPLPVETFAESIELWAPHRSSISGEHQSTQHLNYNPTNSRSISGFNAAARLSSILGQIIESLYSVKQVVRSRHTEANRLEEILDRFYLDLPESLKCDFTNGAPAELPPPHVLTLNMQYWNAVLLLHRPFLHRRTPQRRESPDSVNSPADSDVLRATSVRALDICKRAASHVSRLIEAYRRTFCLRRSSPFLCYYVFSAAIMHVVVLSYQGEESGETIRYLQQSMEALKEISVLWPSAGRAWELIKGCRASVRRIDTLKVDPSGPTRRQKDDSYWGPTSSTRELQGGQYSQNRGLAHSRSLSQVRGTSRLNFTDGLETPSDVSYPYPQGRPAQSSFYSTGNDPSGASRGFIQSNTPVEPSLPPWATNDGSSARQPFNPTISHTRSASAGSYRDYGNSAAMPHFWSDPFTDSTLLTSNYYGLPTAMDQSVGVTLDQQAGSGYGRVNYTPFDASNF
ncbi:hypothetical protein CPB86DRAFT_871039 [Serendipita vermifera]|nr:hypothetical protein CPB86DRAFT_871039 [Serendipita vermifera]